MKHKILLTSLVAMFAVGSAFADNPKYVTGNGNECVDTVLGTDTGPATLEADWALNTYNIIYNNMTGATNNANNPATYNIEQTPLVLGNPTKTGYYFGGWYENSGLTGTAVTQLDSTNLPNPDQDGANKDLWAKWNIKTDIVCPDGYYLPAGADTCSAQCPAGSYCPGNDGAGETPFTFDDDPTPEDQGIFACEGNTISAAGATSCTACPTGQTANNEHTSCSANNISLSWTVDGVAATGGATSCEYGSGITTLPTQPSKPGYHFVGWKVTTDTQSEP